MPDDYFVTAGVGFPVDRLYARLERIVLCVLFSPLFLIDFPAAMQQPGLCCL